VLEDDTILDITAISYACNWDELNLTLPSVVDRLSSAEKVATTTSTINADVRMGLNFKSIFGEVILATKSRRSPIAGHVK
jgi:hypothetical protein